MTLILKKPHRFIFVVAALILALSLNSCFSSSTTDKALKNLNVLIKSIEVIEKTTGLYEKGVITSVLVLQKEIQREGKKRFFFSKPHEISLPKISRKWEKNWNKVSNRTNKLQNRVGKLDLAAQRYFQRLDELSAGITSTSLREEEEKKNKALRKEWSEIYGDTLVQLNRAKKLETRGSDFHKVMLGTAIRKEISKHLSTLSSIAQEAESISIEINSLALQGKSLAEASRY